MTRDKKVARVIGVAALLGALWNIGLVVARLFGQSDLEAPVTWKWFLVFLLGQAIIFLLLAIKMFFYTYAVLG